MALTPGTRFGAYEVIEPIGSGGMGEVYRATDTNLKRDVALKVLPKAFVEDSDRLARFQREAEILASLNHPNIATIHDLEKLDDQIVIVMELVEGPTLADRIAEGPIPPDEAMGIAMQILAALEAAHEKQIVHRDLKPANVKVRDDGTVKVLDFGISKPIDPAAISGSAVATTPAVTQTGVILGTAAYMSPEQARGKFVDQRTDVWAFGCLLFEMLTGQPAFGGEDVMLTLARVLANETNLDSIPGTISPAVRHTLELCLKKDPRRRLHAIGDVRLSLEGALERDGGGDAETTLAPPPAWRRAAVPGATLATGALLAAVIAFALWPSSEPKLVTELAHVLPEGIPLRAGNRNLMALSPDGRRLVYNLGNGLHLRELDSLETRVIPGTEGLLRSPFFSADGQSLAYRTFGPEGNVLKQISVSGGAPVDISDNVPDQLRRAKWERDGTILYSQGGYGIFRVPATGGEPELVIAAREGEVLGHPSLLPNGEYVLFTVAESADWDDALIVAESLVTGERVVLIDGGSDARYVSTGHLIYALGNGLFGRAFDLATLSTSGGSVPLVQGVRRAQDGIADYDVADNGTLAYMQGGAVGEGFLLLTWVDRNGDEEPVGIDICFCTEPALSPDQTRIAVTLRESGGSDGDIWIWSLEQRTPTRLTFEPGLQYAPVWSPDSTQIVYSAADGIYLRNANGTGAIEQLLEGSNISPFSWTADGWIVFAELPEGGGSRDIGMFELEGSRERVMLLTSEFSEARHAVSPDGRWLAYESDEGGSLDIYVRPFPDVESGKWQVSSGGGQEPKWTEDGRTLIWAGSDSMMAVQLLDGTAFANTPQAPLLDRNPYLLPGGLPRRYGITPDGERFLLTKAVQNDSETGLVQIVVVENWIEELKERVPVE
jgi:Tol biopolymer transport system component